VYVDATLPFGLRSAPLIFTVIADMVQWIMQKRGVPNAFHFMDDFITLGAAGTSECQANDTIMHGTCGAFTGIEVDSVAMVLSRHV
jgi:hypothetical protein